MIVRRFLAWSQAAPEQARATAAAAMARTFLSPETDAAARAEAEAAITLLLDDESPLVRRALAEVLAPSPRAPRHVVVALAGEAGDTGALVLAASPLLGEADLVEMLATGSPKAQAAIAGRADVTAPLAAAIAEIGEADAVVRLAANPGAAIPDFAMARMVERFGGQATLRAALESREHLPVAIRHALHVETAKAVFAVVRGHAPERVERELRDTSERAALLLAARSAADRSSLVEHLRRTGQLTAGLLLRAAAQGEAAFVSAALAAIARFSPRRASALVAEPRGGGFAALCRKARLGPATIVALRAALAAHRTLAARGRAAGAARSCEVCRSVVEACAGEGFGHGPVASLFRRLEVEFAREAARMAAERMLEVHRIETEEPLLLGAPLRMLPAPMAMSAAVAAAPPAPEPVPMTAEERRQAAFALIVEEAAAAIRAGGQENGQGTQPESCAA